MATVTPMAVVAMATRYRCQARRARRNVLPRYGSGLCGICLQNHEDCLGRMLPKAAREDPEERCNIKNKEAGERVGRFYSSLLEDMKVDEHATAAPCADYTASCRPLRILPPVLELLKDR